MNFVPDDPEPTKKEQVVVGWSEEEPNVIRDKGQADFITDLTAMGSKDGEHNALATIGADTSDIYESGYWNGSSDDFLEEPFEIEIEGKGDRMITELLKDMRTFITDVNKSGALFAARELYMLRFISIKGGECIPNEIDLDPDTFLSIRNMMREYLALGAAACSIGDIDKEEIADGRNRIGKMMKDYRDLTEGVQTRLKDICNSKSRIEETTKDLKEMNASYGTFLERYNFYKKIMYLRKEWKNGGELGNHGLASIGFESYVQSAAANKDITKSFRDSYEREWKLGQRNRWHPKWDIGPSRVCFIEIVSHCSEDNNKDDNRPSIGNTHMKWNFEGGYGRMASWAMRAKGLDLESSGKEYPFVWDNY